MSRDRTNLSRCAVTFAVAIAPLMLIGCSPDLPIDAENGDIAAVKADLAKTPVDASGSDGETALGYAAANGRLQVVRVLLAAGAKVDARDRDGGTPLIYASGGSDPGRDYPGVVAALIAAGADVNAKDNLGTPLTHAAMNGEASVVPILAKAGADVNAQVAWCALFWAARRGDVPMVRALLDAGADVNGTDSETPLQAALEQGHADVAAILREHGGHV